MNHSDDAPLGPIRLLMVEDSAQDAQLVLGVLLDAGLRVQGIRVADEAAYRAALAGALPDAILSDWTLTAFSGERAFEIARDLCPEVPFILVCAAVCETAAMQAMRQGAADYVFKHQLPLLGLALERALQEVRSRRDLLAAQDAQRRHAARVEALLSLPLLAESLGETEFMQRAQDLAQQLTDSPMACVYLVNADQESIEWAAWSGATWAPDGQPPLDSLSAVSQVGMWAQALRQRAPVVINDCANAADTSGLLQGHVPLDRLISVPVLQGALVRMIVAVGNKATPYTAWDLETLRLLVDAMWAGVHQRRVDRALRASDAEKGSITQSATDAIITCDSAGIVASWNHGAQTIFGYNEAQMLGQPVTRIMPERFRALHMAGIQRIWSDARPKILGKRVELQGLRQDGSEFPTESSLSKWENADASFITAIIRDTSERAAQQGQIRLAAQVFAQGREGIAVTDARGSILMVNDAFTRITGYTEAEALGKNPRFLQSGRQGPEFYRAMWDAVNATGEWAGEVWNRSKDGAVYPEWLSISTIQDALGEVTHYVGSFSELSAAKAAESRIQWLSHFDAVTGLPNRALLRDRAEQAISMAQRSGEPLTLIHVGIDRFSSVTDSLGHQSSDELLSAVARRLSDGVREQDSVARLGGKDFVLMLPATHVNGAAHLTRELLSRLSKPYVLNEREVELTCTLGIASYPENAVDFDALLQAAQVAMHRARDLAFGSYHVFSPEIYEIVLAHETQVKELRRAIERDQLHLVYQPQVDMQSGHICGLEALLRWTHPELGEVPPMEFIPVAEEAGVINAIGSWVLRRACRDIRAWLDRGIQVPRVAVNVSPLQFQGNDLLGQIKAALAEFNVAPEMLCIEVTEGTMMQNTAHSEAMLNELKSIGLKLSLDDFGTGYSSLSYLKRFPFDQVKIDQSFVRDITTDANDAMLVKVIVSMAHGFGMKVIAEGVETEAQCETLRTSVCDMIQGYFFSRPVSTQAIEELFSGGHHLSAHLLRQSRAQRTLLLVDDEPNILSALKRLFRRDGHVILTANGGAEGLEILSKHKVDVIMSDQRMPVMTGVEFLRQAKVHYPDTIRIVLSGYTELQSVTDAINEGAVYRFLTKPWEDEVLREQIRKALAYKDVLEDNRQLDIEIQSANQELVAANRQLANLLQHEREQAEFGERSLRIARDALECVPLPVLAIDGLGVIVFANQVAQQALAPQGPLMGAPLAGVLPTVQVAMTHAAGDGDCTLAFNGKPYRVQWRGVDVSAHARGTLITLLPLDAPTTREPHTTNHASDGAHPA